MAQVLEGANRSKTDSYAKVKARKVTIRDQGLRIASRLWVELDRRRQLLVLTFHRVGGDSKIGPKQVRQHLTWLAKKYRTVLPSELERVSDYSRVALVTIDDCHEDVHEIIFPIARALGVPLTICVPTDFFFRKQWLWFDRVRWALGQAAVGKEVATGNGRLVVGSRESEEEFVAHLKRQSIEERDATIERLVKELGVKVPDTPAVGFRPVSEPGMREMLGTGLVEICSHTVSHPIVSRVSDEELRAEWTESKRELEAFCGKEVISSCYPNGGVGDFDERTRAALVEAGYRIAFTSVEGLNRPGRMDLLELKRIHSHPRYSVFLKLASGLGDLQRNLTNVRLWRRHENA